MDEQRKKIIINEIKHWKNSQLLPGHFCDFLLALYTEGDVQEEEQESILIEEQKTTVNPFHFLFILLNFILSPTMFIFVFFVVLSNAQMITLLTLTVIISIGLFYLGYKIYQIPFQYVFAALLLNICIISITTVNQWFYSSSVAIIVIFLQLVIWLILSIKWKIKLVLSMSVVGIVVCLIAIII
ncbi:hypothetical protein [Amphibacillus cookii]|uniref:hypothetical protein n=1 Tax=Amphibacillus cookii TaxID=767787 RepID=UPI0019570FC4|nr:hypothetical protein [Amphibacillus cookii]MBM7543212.1 hypothetical protein [Amphibacillus cookii]